MARTLRAGSDTPTRLDDFAHFEASEMVVFSCSHQPVEGEIYVDIRRDVRVKTSQAVSPLAALRSLLPRRPSQPSRQVRSTDFANERRVTAQHERGSSAASANASAERVLVLRITPAYRGYANPWMIRCVRNNCRGSDAEL